MATTSFSGLVSITSCLVMAGIVGPAGLVAQQRVSVIEVSEIAAFSGTPQAPFGLVIDADIAPSGEILVLDGINSSVEVFSPDGEHQMSYGRKGRGPGEFGMSFGMTVTEDGLVVVTDEDRLVSWRIGSSEAGPVMRVHEGRQILAVGAWEEGLAVKALSMAAGEIQVLRVLPHEGTAPTVVWRDQLPEPTASSSVEDLSRGLATCVGCAFAASLQNSFFVSAPDSTYAFREFDRNGQMVRLAERPIPPVPLEGEDLRRHQRRWRLPGQTQASTPRYRRMIANIVLDGSGHQWIQRFSTGDGDLVTECVGRDPNRAVEVALPGRESLRAVRGDRLLTVRTLPETGETQAVLYQIVGTGAADACQIQQGDR